MATDKKPAGRPRKPVEHVRSEDLRIPVTTAEKHLVQEAAMAAGGTGEMASWARTILIREAQSLLESEEPVKKPVSHSRPTL